MENQNAFLLGHSIHRVILLANEVLHLVLHKPQAMGEDFLLFKLDTIKAFDYLGWAFLIQLLTKIGWHPNFIRMVKVTNASTTSFVLIQGKLSTSFQLRRLVWKGCPLSPLLFDLIAANALSNMIRGVHIKEMGEFHTHGQHADVIDIVIVAKRRYI